MNTELMQKKVSKQSTKKPISIKRTSSSPLMDTPLMQEKMDSIKDIDKVNRLNTKYSKKPPYTGWPYKKELSTLWKAEKKNEFAGKVQGIQENDLGFSEKNSDGILGRGTAKKMLKKKEKSIDNASTYSEYDRKAIRTQGKKSFKKFGTAGMSKKNALGSEDKKVDQDAFLKTQKRIENASSSMGTDEESIYSAIRETTERTALQENSQIKSLLASELSGFEYAKALLLLRYGNESSFPLYITSLWSASEGMGTDEDLIFRTMISMSPSDLSELKRNDFFLKLLKDEFSGSELKHFNDILEGNAPLIKEEDKEKVGYGKNKSGDSIAELMQEIEIFRNKILDNKVSNKGVKFKALKNPNAYKKYFEIGKANKKHRKKLIILISQARKRIVNITDKDKKSKYYKKLNEFTPYYTQMANKNILSRTGKQAWARTCNVTSLAMTLEGLGIGTQDFMGDKKKLVEIANNFEDSIETFENLTNYRLADFLQFLAIYQEYKGGKDKKKSMQSAKNRAKSMILNAPKFLKMVTLFGVKFELKYFSYKLTKAKYGDYSELTKVGKFYKKHKKVSKKSKEKQLQYKNLLITEISPHLNVGKQIQVNKLQHFVRLQSIDEKGIIIDDPANGGKDRKLTWKESYRGAYFRKYAILSR